MNARPDPVAHSPSPVFLGAYIGLAKRYCGKFSDSEINSSQGQDTVKYLR